MYRRTLASTTLAAALLMLPVAAQAAPARGAAGRLPRFPSTPVHGAWELLRVVWGAVNHPPGQHPPGQSVPGQRPNGAVAAPEGAGLDPHGFQHRP
jgi:hypothetical protein